jgi:hypothetical protein
VYTLNINNSIQSTPGKETELNKFDTSALKQKKKGHYLTLLFLFYSQSTTFAQSPTSTPNEGQLPQRPQPAAVKVAEPQLLPQESKEAKKENKRNKQASKTVAVDCRLFHMNYEFSESVFSGDGKSLYFLAKKPAEQEAKEPFQRSMLYSTDLVKNKVYKIMDAEVLPGGILLSHQNAISYLTYKVPGEKDCYRGEAMGFSVVIDDKPKLVNSFTKGAYQVVRSSLVRSLIDLSDYKIKEFDFKTLQQRKAVQLSKSKLPLYLDFSNQRAYELTKNRKLIRTMFLKKTPELTLPLNRGEKLLQQDKLFAVISRGSQKNQFVLQLKSDWALHDKNLILTMPPKNPLSSAVIKPNFKNLQLLLYGRLKQGKISKWTDILIWDMVKNQEITHKALTPNEYVAVGEFVPDTTDVILVLKDATTEYLTRILAYSAKSKEWTSLEIPH